MVKNYGSMGVENIHIVDLDGTRDGKSGNGEVIEEIIEKSNLKGRSTITVTNDHTING